MANKEVYYTVEIPYDSINGLTWIEYREYISQMGPDWWNTSPIKFFSEDEAVEAIKTSESFSDCKWRVIKTVITKNIVRESNN